MIAQNTPLLTIPGYQGSGPTHWQSIWEKKYLTAKRIEQDDWNHPDCKRWVDTLEKNIVQQNTPPLLIAHSLGCITVVHWAQQFHHTIKGALLVAPADAENPNFTQAKGFNPIPREQLPFPSIVVASTNDPYMPCERAQFFAKYWGSTYVNLGAVGHINVESGFGSWPEGELLLKKLL